MGSIRVVWLLKQLGIGGAERLLLEIAPHVQDVEFHPVVVSALPLDLKEAFNRAGFDVRVLGARGTADLRWLPQFASFCRSVRPHVVHLHNPYPAAGGRLAIAFRRMPIAYTEHNIWERYHPLSRIANAATLGMNDKVIAVSEPVRERILASAWGRRIADRIEVIHNGIGIEAVQKDAKGSGSSLDEPSYGTVGHLRFSKGIDVLLRAALIIQDELPAATGYVVGSGEDESALTAQRSRLGATSVRFLGVRHDARQLMRQLGVFVVASRHEGLPLALLEAMSLSRPIVATRVGGIPDVLVDGENALLVQPEDVGGLARSIVRLLKRPGLAHRLGSNALRTVEEHFNSATTAAGYRRVYEELIQS